MLRPSAMADSCVTAKTAAAELAAAAEAGAREIVVEGRLTGSPSITLPEGTTLRGAELALLAKGVRHHGQRAAGHHHHDHSI